MAMTAPVLGDRGLPWTEEDYLALGYTEQATAGPGELLAMTEPVAVTIDPAALLRR
jgi:hypothetical protein